ncbi:unnamed protein product [Haemonchus placei]|uniref:G_PROTEIN_RECEP_F1_2 domain-containing protein n=1 Tax=Haemonchus placei TaxID=6290 RepID=A0A158QN22_HAEPC|nr:unnamed protein product [Haemonchus placei]
MSNFSCLDDHVTVACLNLIEAIITIASMLTVMLIIILGNLLVVVTVYCDRKLRLQRQNWLIISLALADLLVGLLVMPLTLIYEIIGEWKMGNVLCEMWLALDVLFVTASILHICAISLDRYFSVTSPLTYPSKRTPTRMFVYIGVAWVVSLLICLPPIFGWRPERRPGECAVSTDVGYVLYSSLGSFYIPVIILVLVYARIYSITIKHSRQRLKETERRDQTLSLLTAKPSRYFELSNWNCLKRIQTEMTRNIMQTRFIHIFSFGLLVSEHRLYLELDLYSFLIQFVMYVIGAFGYEAPAVVFKFFFWLGYCNSGINPVIYTVFNREFKRGLCRQLHKFERYLRSLTDFYK